jgi:hypothetical protein
VIYFIQDSETLYIKIGFTAQRPVAARMKALQTACPGRLTLLIATEGDKEGERFFHDKLAEFRVRGEWFRPTWKVIRSVMYAQHLKSFADGERHAAAPLEVGA